MLCYKKAVSSFSISHFCSAGLNMRARGEKKPTRNLSGKKKKPFSQLLQCDCSPGDQFLPSGSQVQFWSSWWHGEASPWGHEGRGRTRCPVCTGKVGQALEAEQSSTVSCLCSPHHPSCSTWCKDLTSPSPPGDLQCLSKPADELWLQITPYGTYWDGAGDATKHF